MTSYPPYGTAHGPRHLPWWRPAKLHIVRCGPGDPVRYFWLKGIGYNIWLYTRWGTWCWYYAERRGVYRQEEIDRRGWF